MPHRCTRTIELPGDIHGECAVPILRRDFIDATSRPRDTGIVDQAIEAAEMTNRLVEKAHDRIAIGDIAYRSA